MDVLEVSDGELVVPKHFASAVGLPLFDGPITEELFRSGVEVIKRLGEFLGQQGLSDGISVLKETETVQENDMIEYWKNQTFLKHQQDAVK
jgi:hypothetical protein